MNSRSTAPPVLLVLTLTGILLLVRQEPSLAASVVFRVATSLILFGIITYISNTRRLRFPGPLTLPLIGNVLDLAAQGNIQESFRR